MTFFWNRWKRFEADCRVRTETFVAEMCAAVEKIERDVEALNLAYGKPKEYRRPGWKTPEERMLEVRRQAEALYERHVFAPRGSGPLRFEWYSVCSGPLGHEPGCPRCANGVWVNVWMNKVENFLFKHTPALWRLWKGAPQERP